MSDYSDLLARAELCAVSDVQTLRLVGALRATLAKLAIAREALERVANAGLGGVCESGCGWCLDDDGRERLEINAHWPGCPVGDAIRKLDGEGG